MLKLYYPLLIFACIFNILITHLNKLDYNTTMLTKSDFLLYLKAPLHLWAEKHNKLNKLVPSVYEQHLMKQGYEVEKLAHKLLPYATWQKAYVSDEFEIRRDALIKNTDGTYDLYEVKSSTTIKKEHMYDVTFQSVVIKDATKLNKIFIVTLNKDYIFKDKLDINKLFLIVDVTDKVRKLTDEVEEKMRDAIDIIEKDKPEYIEICLKPDECPCLNLCHPNLPKKSIFNIPSIHPKRKRELLDSKIIDIYDVPDSFPLSSKQRKILNILRSNTPYLNNDGLHKFLNTFVFPIYFLDYETYSLAVPIYNGYKPYQHMVFQYSLHIVNEDRSTVHSEYLQTELGDPSKNLIIKLKEDIGEIGSVIVWIKTFEKSCNENMSKLYPEYKDFLLDLNKRIIDLADFIKKEHYIHPDFLGSWSIKDVLPVMIPDLSYKNLKVNKGDQAMLVWWELIHTTDKLKAKELLEYCTLDTLAMFKIWEKLTELSN